MSRALFSYVKICQVSFSHGIKYFIHNKIYKCIIRVYDTRFLSKLPHCILGINCHLFCACYNQVDVWPVEKKSGTGRNGGLQKSTGSTVHHLGDKHWRTSAEAAITLFLLVLFIVAVKVMALRQNISYDDTICTFEILNRKIINHE